MTVPLDQFQRCFAKAQDANIKAAQMAGAMAEMGRYAKELTVYGSVLWRKGKRIYALSSAAEKVYDFLERDEQLQCLSVPVVSQRTSLWVPSGCEEAVGRAVRRALAKQMAEDHPTAFFEMTESLIDKAADNLAEGLLDELQDTLEGTFDQVKLTLFAGLVQMAYQRRQVTPSTWQRYRVWLARQEREMANDVLRRERFQQTFYGFVYQKADGSWEYYANAVKGTACQRLSVLKASGHLTSTLVSKNLSQAHSCPLRELRADFLAYLAEIFDAAYCERLLAIDALPSVVEQEAFDQTLAEVQRTFGKPSSQALKQWGRSWGVTV